ncbi:MAG: glutamine--fructose-6-phosphate transaminase (isomerizing) [Opitutales bacterium]|nr:glutamine--fructose-6-phosphate transaminase (isomerizing) [Opitutales bacterium]
MCGITGYIGKRDATPILIEGLKRLEYRGYDSAGIALLDHNEISLCKKTGRVDVLAEEVSKKTFKACMGISHTRWATHGGVTDDNAHPHISSDGKFALVHNGIIENFESIKVFLSKKGYSFKSQTDTEALVNLIAYHYEYRTDANSENRFLEAVRKALIHIEGTYGIAVISKENPDVIIAARKGSPLLIGIGKNERLVSSDVLGFAGRANNVIYLDDNQIACITIDNCDIISIGNNPIEYKVKEIDWELENADLDGSNHYMHKEIFEQPKAIENAIRGRISDDASTAILHGLNMTPQEMRQIDRIIFCACGTAWHACLIAEQLIEKYARIPVEVEYASEFRYRNTPIEKNTLVFVLSQSGETIDTLEALRESQRKGFKTLAITNAIASTISRESDGGLYQYAGKEVGVASTKAFTSQVVICMLVALHIGRMRDLSYTTGKEIVNAIKNLPDLVKETLKQAENIKEIAKKYANNSDFLYLGRLDEFPVALEGALKLKEISYIHAEAYPAGEMKHGPIALICPECPSVIFANSEDVLSKVVSNAQEIKARKGKIIAITSYPDAFKDLADDIITLPKMHDCVRTIIATIPAQLLAYYIALELGCDVDKPRNLAKAVTVE